MRRPVPRGLSLAAVNARWRVTLAGHGNGAEGAGEKRSVSRPPSLPGHDAPSRQHPGAMARARVTQKARRVSRLRCSPGMTHFCSSEWVHQEFARPRGEQPFARAKDGWRTSLPAHLVASTAGSSDLSSRKARSLDAAPVGRCWAQVHPALAAPEGVEHSACAHLDGWVRSREQTGSDLDSVEPHWDSSHQRWAAATCVAREHASRAAGVGETSSRTTLEKASPLEERS